MSIHAFPDFDSMMRAEQAAQTEAEAQIQDWQRNLKPGDYFLKEHPCGISIWGEVLPVDDDDEERLPGYILVNAFSAVLKDGEVGEMHVSTITRKVSGVEFIAAKGRGWT